MIGVWKAVSHGSDVQTQTHKFSAWLAGAAVAVVLAVTPQIASARDHDGGGRHRGGHEGRSYAGRGQTFNANTRGDGGRGFSGRDSGSRNFGSPSFEGRSSGDRNIGERRFGNRESGTRSFAERGREFGGRDRTRDFGQRQFDGRRFDGRYDGRRYDGGRRDYSRPYYGRGYGGWRGSRWWGPSYFVGFGSYYDDYLAAPYYGLAAWEMAEYAYLTELQVRAQEDAMIAATSGPLNDPIEWNDGTASGSVTPLRDGATDDGRTCREFQQEITVDGKRQRAYGTACREPDGSWQMVEK